MKSSCVPNTGKFKRIIKAGINLLYCTDAQMKFSQNNIVYVSPERITEVLW